MSQSIVRKSAKGLLEYARKQLALNSRRRFILLLSVLNTMFCCLILLSVQTMQLDAERRELEQDKTQMGSSLETTEALATEAVERAATLERQIRELLKPKPTSTTSPPTATPTAVPPIPVTTATMTLTPAPPTPTSTAVLPPPTHTPVPPTPTPEPTPTSSPKPPKPEASPTCPS
jgi:hypothetical protein